MATAVREAAAEGVLGGLTAKAETSAPGSALHKTIMYTLKRWPALVTYLEDGRVPVDNNRCERAMRPVA